MKKKQEDNADIRLRELEKYRSNGSPKTSY